MFIDTLGLTHVPASLREFLVLWDGPHGQGQLPGIARLVDLLRPWQPAALVSEQGLPNVLLFTCLFCLHYPTNLGFSF